MELLVLAGLSIPAFILAFLLVLCLKNFEKIGCSLKKMSNIGIPRGKNIHKKREQQQAEIHQATDFNFLDFSGGSFGI